MQIGSIVRYNNKYPHAQGGGSDSIGLVIDDLGDDLRFHVQWNNGVRQWNHKDVLELICE